MTKKPDDPIEQDRRRLRELRELIPAVNNDRDALYAERLTIWQRLRAAGVPRREMADLAGVGVDMVKQALNPKGRVSARTGG